MTWTAPAVVTTGQLITAAFWNSQVRDNMLETAAATVTTAGDLAYADAANSMGSRLAIGAAGTRLVSTGSAPVWRATGGMTGDATYTAAGAFPTAFTDLSSALWGAGTTVAATVTTGTAALVHFGARYAAHPTLGSSTQLSFRVSSATTVAASTNWGTLSESDPAGTATSPSRTHLISGLTAGSNVFTLQGLVSSGAAATLTSPFIAVEAL